MASAGSNLIHGLFNGISNATSWLYNKLSGWVSNVLSYIKSKFGIHSPSKKTAVFGKFLAQGLAVGMLKNVSSVNKASKLLATQALKAIANTSKTVSKGISDTTISKGVTVSANYDTSSLKTLDNISGSISLYSDGLNSAFDSFIDRSAMLLDRWIDSIHSGNNRGISSGGNSVVINMGDTNISGVVDKDSAEQVKAIADKQIDDVLDALSPYIPNV